MYAALRWLSELPSVWSIYLRTAPLSDPWLKGNAELPAAKWFMGKLTSLQALPSDADLAAWITKRCR